jgi:hypothetical protein
MSIREQCFRNGEVTGEDRSRSRNAHHWAPPPRIRACGITASGSCLGSSMDRRSIRHGISVSSGSVSMGYPVADSSNRFNRQAGPVALWRTTRFWAAFTTNTDWGPRRECVARAEVIAEGERRVCGAQPFLCYKSHSGRRGHLA